MAKQSPGELELLRRGARAIAEMQQLGMDVDDIQTAIAGGVERMQRGQRRRQNDPEFAFRKPFRKGMEYETELRPTDQRDLDPFGRERRNPEGRVIRQYKKPGATPPRPPVTEAYVNAVMQRIAQANEGLLEPRIIKRANPYELEGDIEIKLYNDDFGQRTIEGNKKQVADKEDRMLEEVGFVDEDRTVDRGAAEKDSFEAEQAGIFAEEKAERLKQKKENLRKYQPRFENLAGVGYGMASGEGMPQTQAPLRKGVDAVKNIKDAVAAGQLSLDQSITIEGNDITGDFTTTPRALIEKLENRYDPKVRLGNQKEAVRNLVAENPISQEVAARNQSDVLSAVERERANRGPLGDLSEVGDLFADEDYQATAEQKLNAGLIDERGALIDSSTALAGSNTPNTNNALNAPTSESAVDWVAKQVNAEGSASMFEGQRIPYVDIGGQTSALEGSVQALIGQEFKVRDARGISRRVTPFDQSFVDQIGPIRSIGGLQRASDEILRVGQAAGINFPRMVFTEGLMKAEQGAVPGVGEVLDFLKMNAGAQQKLGIALNNLDLADQNVVGGQIVNAAQKDQFARGQGMMVRNDINFGVKDLPKVDGKGGVGKQPEADIAMAPAKRAREFRGLQDRDAAMPFIGAEVGDERPAAYIRGTEDGINVIDQEVRGRVFVGGAPERQVRDEAIERLQRRGAAEQAGAKGMVSEETIQDRIKQMRRLDRRFR